MNHTHSNHDKYLLQSVDNALRIIEILAENDELGATAVGQSLGIGKSSAFRLLTTLENRGFVKKDENNKYHLGMKFSYLGTLVLSRLEIVRCAHPILEDLSAATHETSHLVVWDENYMIRFVDKVLSPTTINIPSHVGLTKECYSTATGQVLLADKSHEFVENMITHISLSPKTPHTITNPQKLRDTLQRIRADGFYISVDEDELGLTCIAAPIRDAGAQVVAAVSISGPTGRMLGDNSPLIHLVVDAAHKISRSIS